MYPTLCSTTDQLISSSSNEVYVNTEHFFIQRIFNIWVKPIFELTPQIDNIRQTYVDLVSAKQFEKAIDFMLNEIYEHSKILALKFKIPFEDRTDIAFLFEKLRCDEVVSVEEWNRLTILQMAMDGLDIEVYEYGASIRPNELGYLNEFLDIIRTILARNNTYVGVSIGASFSSYVFQGANTSFTIASTGTLVINPTCVLSNALINLVSTSSNSVNVTTFQAN